MITEDQITKALEQAGPGAPGKIAVATVTGGGLTMATWWDPEYAKSQFSPARWMLPEHVEAERRYHSRQWEVGEVLTFCRGYHPRHGHKLTQKVRLA